jgi:hypothetical protein
LLRPRPRSAIDQQEIWIAIIVKIEKSDPATHGFWEKFFTIGAAHMSERNSGYGSNIGEGSPWDRESGFIGGREWGLQEGDLNFRSWGSVTQQEVSSNPEDNKST